MYAFSSLQDALGELSQMSEFETSITAVVFHYSSLKRKSPGICIHRAPTVSQAYPRSSGYWPQRCEGPLLAKLGPSSLKQPVTPGFLTRTLHHSHQGCWFKIQVTTHPSATAMDRICHSYLKHLSRLLQDQATV